MDKNEIVTKELSPTELQRAMEHNLEVMISGVGISLDDNEIPFHLTDEYVNGDKTTDEANQHEELDNQEDKPIQDGMTQRKAYFEQDKPPYEVVGVECSQLKASPQQKREDFNERELNALADSIEKDGLLQPVPVFRIYDDQYQYSYHLVGGERRKRAWEIINQRQGTNDLLPCTVLAEYTEAAFNELDNQIGMLLQGIAENRHRASLNFIEMAKAIRAYKDLTGESNDAIAERIFCESSVNAEKGGEDLFTRVNSNNSPKKRRGLLVSQYLKISQLSEEVQQAILEANKEHQAISKRHAYEITGLVAPGSEDDPENQAKMSASQLKVIKAIQEGGLSSRATKELVDKINKGTPAEENQAIDHDKSPQVTNKKEQEHTKFQAKKAAEKISKNMGVEVSTQIEYDLGGVFTKAVILLTCDDLKKVRQIEKVLTQIIDKPNFKQEPKSRN